MTNAVFPVPKKYLAGVASGPSLGKDLATIGDLEFVMATIFSASVRIVNSTDYQDSLVPTKSSDVAIERHKASIISST